MKCTGNRLRVIQDWTPNRCTTQSWEDFASYSPQRTHSSEMNEKNTKTSEKKLSLENLGSVYDPDFPSTHFFYEYDGEREVLPGKMVSHAILLWHEQMLANPLDDTSHLWEFAASLLDQDELPAMCSRLEWLRFQVVIGGLTPDSWKSSDPYPYKGMLIAALYIQEARRLCEEEDPTHRLWHVISMAYYNLGLNSRLSAKKTFAYYSVKDKAEDSEDRRVYVLEVLKRLQGNPKITSIEKAKDAVIDFICTHKNKDGELALLAAFEKLDRYVPEGNKHNKDNNAMDRLRNTLDDWARPNGPYPQMAEAFAAFRRKTSKTASSPPSAPRSTQENIEISTKEFHTRIVLTGSTEFERILHFSNDNEK